jgi:uncharacterized sulfatase
MKRRNFVAGVTAAGLADTLPQQLRAGAVISNQSVSRVAGPAPNILIIIVDQMRYPRVFPSGITNASEFVSQFMPNLNSGIWKPCVKVHRAL